MPMSDPSAHPLGKGDSVLTTTPVTATARTVHRVLTRRRRATAARDGVYVGALQHDNFIDAAPSAKWLALG
jgi:hypothetical protein